MIIQTLARICVLVVLGAMLGYGRDSADIEVKKSVFDELVFDMPLEDVMVFYSGCKGTWEKTPEAICCDMWEQDGNILILGFSAKGRLTYKSWRYRSVEDSVYRKIDYLLWVFGQ